MPSQWGNKFPSSSDTPLAELVYGSRLLGTDPTLVLHGGGNTSVKADFADITGRTIDTLYIKGSGWDLATITESGFTPLRLERLRELLTLDSISDSDMMNELSMSRLTPGSPQPSVEALLHAYLPQRAVMHSHANAVLALTNSPDGRNALADVFGPKVIVVPYRMPGFGLAKQIGAAWDTHGSDTTEGIVLSNHGLVTFGDTTREAYERHIELIDRAEAWLAANAPAAINPGDGASPDSSPEPTPIEIADLRLAVSEAAGEPMILAAQSDPALAAFAQRSDLADLARSGPLTPDHVIRTKPFPLVGTDVEAFVASYRSYFDHHCPDDRDLVMVDPAPRVIVDPSMGVLTAGRTVTDCAIAADIYSITAPVQAQCEDQLGGYSAAGADHLFDLEYWELQQAKLRLPGHLPELAGTVAFVTGAASGIGRACAAEMLDRGCAVVGVDISESAADTFDSPNWLGLQVDVSDAEAQAAAVETTVRTFGGLDILVVAAGVFGPSTPITDMGAEGWRFVQSINVDSVLALFTACHPFLARSPIKGRVGIIGSKNVSAPGMGAAAYSSSKAALTQLGRVAALEWAADGIRINNVHPDAVFDTGLWTPELLAERAEKYGLSIEEYKKRNLLRTEVTSAKVAYMIGELCSDGFSATTGAQIPIDGGSDRVI